MAMCNVAGVKIYCRDCCRISYFLDTNRRVLRDKKIKVILKCYACNSEIEIGWAFLQKLQAIKRLRGKE